jgi:NTE family protein
MNEIALALGGGGVKGIAHIGVIRVLEREGFKIRAIAGTSAGGLVGALIASGFSPSQIEHLIQNMNNARFYSRTPTDGPSLLGLAGLNEILINEIHDRVFENLTIPFACTSVDLNTAQEVILAQGSIIDAVMATIAVPGIFPPRQIGEFSLVDGGILDPVPVSLARWLAPSLPIIAVCLQPTPEKWAHFPHQISMPMLSPIPRPLLEQFAKMRIGQAFHIFVDSFDISTRMLAELRLQQDRPDVIIRPRVEKYGILDQANPAELIMLGEKAANDHLNEIREALSWSNQLGRIFRRAEPPGKILPAAPE